MIKDLDLLKKRVNFSRYSFFEEMERHLLTFESHFFAKGIKVVWNSDERALEENIVSLLPNNNFNKVCFSNEKFGENFTKYNKVIKRMAVESFEKSTDLADVLVIEADFGIVENGSIIMIDQPGINDLNKVNNLFIILDISKIVLKVTDFENILYLTDFKHKKRGKSIKIINSSFFRHEKEMFEYNDNQIINKNNIKINIFFYNNKVTDLLEDINLRESLYCIHCGKCAEVCPIYKYTGEYSPIELIKSEIIEENVRKQNIFSHTTLCGNCSEVCPVLIPITDILVKEMEKASLKTSQDRQYDFVKMFSKRSRVNKLNNKLRRYFFIKRYFGKNKNLYQYFRNQKDTFYNISGTKESKTI